MDIDNPEFTTNGQPSLKYQKYDPVGHNYLVEEFAETIKKKMCDSDIESAHLVLVTRSKDGVIEILNARDENKSICMSKVVVPIHSTKSATELYNCLSEQLYIHADFIGTADDPHLDITVGDQDKVNCGVIKIGE